MSSEGKMAPLFQEETWEKLYTEIADAFSMGPTRTVKLASNKVAKLIAAIPFLAECENPERAALAHMGTYIVAGSGGAREVFDHKPDDDGDVMTRLAMGTNFEGGNPAVLARGMRVLAWTMVKGYVRKAEENAAAGYNPIAARKWDAGPMLARLEAEISAAPNPDMDSILGTADKGIYWEG
jgi:hypothetical protein